MPEFLRRSALCIALLAALPALAQDDTPPADEPTADTPTSPIVNSTMDGPMFFQLLVGEMQLAKGDKGSAYQVLLDAARRTQDEGLFKQVLGIAMQARAGEEALQAAKAWREAKPGSREAQLTTLQLQAALGRPAGSAAALRDLLSLTPEAERAGVIASLPVLFQRAADPKAVYAEYAPLLREQAKVPELRDTTQLVQARLAIAAGQSDEALDLTRQLAAARPQADEPIQLALDLMPSRPAAENIITARLAAQPDNQLLHMAYGRSLLRAQRGKEAAEQFRGVTVAQPDNATAWFALGTVELEQQNAPQAEAALRKYLSLLPAVDVPNVSDDANSIGISTRDARQQAWLMLSLAAERQGNLRAASDWLGKIESPKDPAALASRRADLLGRLGKTAEARKLIDALPEKTEAEQRGKQIALAQFLRSQRDWSGADAALAKALELQPGDADLLYERAMLAEKLGRLDQMEAGLRRVMTLKPDYYSAYNALGYSLADRNERLPEARELITKALSYAPNEPALIDSLGWLAFREGKHDEALTLLRKAYAAFPDPEVATHLGEVLWTRGDQQEALRVWREAHERDPKNEVLQETLARLRAKL
ncbi:tetratricopeptide repeat protein [Burkholderiaceae bacterium UC74_6]